MAFERKRISATSRKRREEMTRLMPKPFHQLLPILVVLSTALSLSDGVKEWRYLVNSRARACCGDTKVTQCKPPGVTLAKDGKFYLFIRDRVLEVDNFRPNKYPEIRQGAYKKSREEWTPFKGTKKTNIEYVFSFSRYTILRDSVRTWHTYEWDDGNKKTAIGTQTDCKTPIDWHPILCEKHVTGVASYTRSEAPDEPYIAGYLDQGSQEFTIKWYKGNTSTVTSDAKVKGTSPIGISVYRRDVQKKVEDVVSFNKHGFACFFTRKWEDESFRFSASEPPIDETFNPRMPECWQVQTFLGCPQSFCHRNDVDDMFRGAAGEKVILMRGHYLWQIEDKALPFARPTRDKAKLMQAFELSPYQAYVDAADIVVDNKGRFVLQFKDSKVYTMINHPQAVPKGTPIATTFPGIAAPYSDFLDAVWFNQALKQLFLFRDEFFWVFAPTFEGDIQKNSSSIAWTIVSNKRLIGDYLRGLPKNIDGVLSKDGKAYVLKEQWFYELTENSWDNLMGDIYKPMLMYGGKDRPGFFSTLDDCDISKESMHLIEGRLKPPKAEEGSGRTPYTGTLRSTDATTVNGGGPWFNGFYWWVIFVVTVLLLLVAAVILYFVYFAGKEKDKKAADNKTSTEEATKGPSPAVAAKDPPAVVAKRAKNPKIESQMTDGPKSGAPKARLWRLRSPLDLNIGQSLTPCKSGTFSDK